MSASEYRASIKAASSSGPGRASLHAYQPVRCLSVDCLAVSIGGRYEWDLTSENGWRIRLKMMREASTGAPGKTPEPDLYCGEFYRGTEGKLFRSRRVTIGPEGSERYAARIVQEEGCGSSEEEAQAEMTELAEKMQNIHKLSEKEQERLMQRYEQLLAKTQEQQLALLARMQDPDFARKEEEEQRQFGCQGIYLQLSPGGVEGHVNCGSPVRSINVKGTMKYVGP